MSLIPGSIPVTGFIAPTDTADTYAVTDAIYGIDGLRNVPTYTEMYDISLERRRSGMIVGVMSDNTYWKLLPSTGSNIWGIGSASNWQEFAIFGGNGVGVPNQYYIPSGEKVVVPTYSQYWIYGDLTIAGELENYGQVVIANGGLVLSGGTFSGMTGSLSFVSLGLGISSYLTSSTIGFNVNGPTLSADIIVNSITTSLLSTTAGSATAGYILSNDGVGNFTWISPSNGSSQVITRLDKNFIMSYDTSGNGQFTGLTISATPVNGCYVAVFINGQEFDVGDGVTMSTSCYFSNDGGTTARNFTSPNQVQVGDGLYWNNTWSGTDLYTSWRISLYYLT
jgi:hypothetical protein